MKKYFNHRILLIFICSTFFSTTKNFAQEGIFSINISIPVQEIYEFYSSPHQDSSYEENIIVGASINYPPSNFSYSQIKDSIIFRISDPFSTNDHTTISFSLDSGNKQLINFYYLYEDAHPN